MPISPRRKGSSPGRISRDVLTVRRRAVECPRARVVSRAVVAAALSRDHESRWLPTASPPRDVSPAAASRLGTELVVRASQKKRLGNAEPALSALQSAGNTMRRENSDEPNPDLHVAPAEQIADVDPADTTENNRSLCARSVTSSQ